MVLKKYNKIFKSVQTVLMIKKIQYGKDGNCFPNKYEILIEF